MAPLKLIPLADRIVVQPFTPIDPADDVHPEQGKVLAVGKGRIGDDNERIPLEVSVGDTVVFTKYGPEVVTVDGIAYLLLREDQILAIIRDEVDN